MNVRYFPEGYYCINCLFGGAEMTKKIITVIIDICIYYLCALLVCLCFKWLGWLEHNIFVFALGITIGWSIAQLIIEFVKNKKNKLEK